MDVRRRVGLNLRKYRRELGLTQEAFAFQSGIDRTYISGIERGVRNPTIVILEEIAQALGISTAKLLEEIAPKGKAKSRRS